MKQSTSKILTTHTGSLPRTGSVAGMLEARDNNGEVDPQAFESGAEEAVAEVVSRQIAIGLDVINDGEQSKPSYATYVKDRFTGFDGQASEPPRVRLDDIDFPEWAADYVGPSSNVVHRPACNGPIAWSDWPAVGRDLDRLKKATQGREAEEVFMTSASPGVIARFLPNQYFDSEEAYLYALADVMKNEYNAVVDAGFLLQIDCPDLASSRNTQFGHLTVDEFKKIVELHIEVLNHALAGIPPERLRMHLCWGNFEGPHIHDVPFRDIVDIVLKARPAGLSFEGANPRHEHEWKIWQDVKLPEGKVIIPGVLDSTTNFIEHPELIADRIARYAGCVGRENVIAGSDCGYGTFIMSRRVDASVAWAKLASLVEGAKLATNRLFP
ncbi:MAG: cobalamin-independent methionine synthase II family protein [Chloroflexota bacterium]|nr:cobalamin-independent methionine synthase II family protein [Chloroflexota bacterium]MED5569707.1 cobalamin-independent methionine synthase II family protein [Chloroflexota bacterium]